MTGPADPPASMHMVFDACAAEPGSIEIVLLNLLRGWRASTPGDRVTVLRPRDLRLPLPEGVEEYVLRRPLPGPMGSVYERTVAIRVACRSIGASALLSVTTASALLGSGCPRAVMLHDLRHEALPGQFALRRRVARRALYAWSFRRADRVVCISNRTRSDLLGRRPGLAGKAVVAPLGSDHVLAWPPGRTAPRRYALAFGHFANKNASAVIAAWAQLCRSVEDIDLCLVGMSDAERRLAADQIASLGIGTRVRVAPWLDDEAFQRTFTSASMVVLPSAFEGFGLPAIEAMRLRVPLVVSSDRALAEVTGGHAIVAHDLAPGPLAAAMASALDADSDDLDAAAAHAAEFTWASTALAVRRSLRDGATPPAARP